MLSSDYVQLAVCVYYYAISLQTHYTALQAPVRTSIQDSCEYTVALL
jgi:hypothetical protein